MSVRGSERGQASAEFVAVVPLVLMIAFAVAQLVVAGYALWSAGDAARAGARAALVDGDPEAAARSALPGFLAESAEVEAGQAVEVRVEAPALLPGVGAIPMRASAALAAGGA